MFWDMYELMSSKVVSTNDYQVRKVAFNRNGDYLSAICYDEILLKWSLDIYAKNHQLIGGPILLNSSKTSIAWHPKNPNLLALAGEVDKKED